MTRWGVVILVAAVVLGLKGPVEARYRYATACVIVVGAVLYAALRQHTW